jgi:hypothetical protein
MAFSTSIRLPSETYTTHANAPRAAPVRAAAKDDADAVAAAAAATADATMVCCLLIMRIKSPLYLSFDETIYPYNNVFTVKDVHKCPPPLPPGDKDDGERLFSVFVPSFSSRFFLARSFHHAMMFFMVMMISRGNHHHHLRSMMMR